VKQPFRFLAELKMKEDQATTPKPRAPMLGVSGARRKDLKVNFFDLIFAPHSVTPAIL
jgi:hypothetical protein